MQHRLVRSWVEREIAGIVEEVVLIRSLAGAEFRRMEESMAVVGLLRMEVVAGLMAAENYMGAVEMKVRHRRKSVVDLMGRRTEVVVGLGVGRTSVLECHMIAMEGYFEEHKGATVVQAVDCKIHVLCRWVGRK